MPILSATILPEIGFFTSLIVPFICAFICKLGITINEICLKNKITFLQENKDWIFLILLILLFAFSYVKQTDYVRKRVEFVLRNEKETRQCIITK